MLVSLNVIGAYPLGNPIVEVHIRKTLRLAHNVPRHHPFINLTRTDLADDAKVAAAVRTLAAHMPTYVTLKDVKKRWGKEQEDVFPIAQFEKNLTQTR